MNRALAVTLIAFALVLVGCGRQLPDPALQPVAAAPTATALSATALPPTEAAATEVLAEATATLAPATATLAEPAAAPVGDAANGAVLFATFYNEVSFACATCHNAASADRLIGPGMLGISVRAATRVDGLTASEYLHTSIVNPSAYVVPDYPDALMPKTYADVLTEAEINDLVAYLLSL